MHDLYAKSCGLSYFTVVYKGGVHRIYKFSYYWSNVGESYVAVFSEWLPEQRRVRLPFDKTAPGAPKWKSPALTFALPGGIKAVSVIRKIEEQLKSVSQINLDKIISKGGNQ